jgi:hypothetical protein
MIAGDASPAGEQAIVAGEAHASVLSPFQDDFTFVE